MAKVFTQTSFTIEMQGDTLKTMSLATDEGEALYSQRAVPPSFFAFAESKGCKISVAATIAGDEANGMWKITIGNIQDFNIEQGDTVRDKNRRLNRGLDLSVVADTELLALLPIPTPSEPDLQWHFKAELDLVSKAQGGFRNAGEAP